jgi:hypothetical protein
MTLTNGGRLVKKGRTYDIECARTTHRLALAQSILRQQGIEAAWPEHSTKCMLHPDNAFNRCFGYSYACDHDCPRTKAEYDGPTWPEWVGEATFNAAYVLACAIQDERGSFNRAAASRLKAAQS